MKSLQQHIKESFKIGKNKMVNRTYRYHPKDRYELKELLKKLILERGGSDDCDLNDIDVSQIKDMSTMFVDHRWIRNIDISDWDMSNVETTAGMFAGCYQFNCNLSRWNVSNVRNMYSMFYQCKKFNCNLGNWDVSNVRQMDRMFMECESFTGDGIENWDVSSAQNMEEMFCRCKKLKKNLNGWKVPEKCKTTWMFAESPMIAKKYFPKWLSFYEKVNT